MIPYFDTYALRRWMEFVQATGKPEQQKEWPDFFDNTRPGQMNGKGRVPLRPLAHVEAVCVHQTAVEFGFSKRLARKIADAEGIDYEAACRKALHRRFYKCPYHVVALPRSGDILLNNIASRYTYHGRGANQFSVGLAIEGRYNRTPKTSRWREFEIETARAGFRLAVEYNRKQGAPIKYVTAHALWSGSRLGDPGGQIWADAIAPLMRELDVVLDERGPAGGGEFWPATLNRWGLGSQ